MSTRIPKFRVVSQTEDLPFTMSELRRHLEQPIYYTPQVDDPDDKLIADKTRAAIGKAEAFLGLALTPRQIELALDTFPTRCIDGHDWIDLPMGPVSEIISVRAGTGTSDSDGTLGDELYALDEFASPQRLVPVSSWPAVRGLNAVRVMYLTGYSLDVDSDAVPISGMPWDIRAAVLLILGDLWSRREDSADGAVNLIPNGAEALLRDHRVKLGLA